PAAAFLLIEAGDLTARAKIRVAFEQAARAIALPFYDDEPAALTALAHEMLKEAGVRMTSDAEALLDSSLPGDRGLWRGEIEKLALFAHRRETPIAAIDIAALLPVEQDAALEDATLAAAAGRAGAAVEALERAGAAGVSAMRALERRLMRLM